MVSKSSTPQNVTSQPNCLNLRPDCVQSNEKKRKRERRSRTDTICSTSANFDFGQFRLRPAGRSRIGRSRNWPKSSILDFWGHLQGLCSSCFFRKHETDSGSASAVSPGGEGGFTPSLQPSPPLTPHPQAPSLSFSSFSGKPMEWVICMGEEQIAVGFCWCGVFESYLDCRILGQVRGSARLRPTLAKTDFGHPYLTDFGQP